VLFSRGVVLGRLELSEVREEVGSDELVVDELGSVEAPGKEAPDEEDALEEPVEGDEGDQEVGEELDDAQRREHHPVGQPEGVVVLVPALDGQDGAVGRVRETHAVGDQLGTEADDDQCPQHEAGAQYQLPALDAGGLLHLGQALVELVLLLQLLV